MERILTVPWVGVRAPARSACGGTGPSLAAALAPQGLTSTICRTSSSAAGGGWPGAARGPGAAR
jgi:hypothetical protein